MIKDITYNPIGVIHSPFENGNGVPIQPALARGIKGTVEVYPEFEMGLDDLDGFSHIILIYHFHLSNGFQLKVKPYLDNNFRGVFATRSPRRPNNIGISVVKLVNVEKNILSIENVDIVNNTPLLDIKPYVPEFNAAENNRIGWLTNLKDKFSPGKQG